MSGDKFKYRGGGINLSAEKPTGLPFRKPLYGLPPYQYTGDILLMIAYEAEEEAVREVLPRELEPLPGNIVAMCFFLCPDVTGSASFLAVWVREKGKWKFAAWQSARISKKGVWVNGLEFKLQLVLVLDQRQTKV
jgi:hypothetical protein